MKVTLRKLFMLVLMALLVGMIGSNGYGYDYVENEGRLGCGGCPAVYWPGEEHVCKSVPVAPDTSSYGQKECRECNTRYPANLTHSCPPPVRVVKKTTPVVRERRYVKSVPVKTESSFNLFPVNAFIRVRITQRPVRYRYIRQYGYGYYRSGLTARGNPVIGGRYWSKRHRYYRRW